MVRKHTRLGAIHPWHARFPLLFVLLLLLGGSACGSDDDLPNVDPSLLDDADDSPVAGTIQASFAISSSGEATYTLPLVVPPGAAGMQPALAIAYSSASGDGLLGKGFSLAGLSAITRCTRNMAQDGQIRAVRNDQGDALCLDGARLVQVGKANGVVEYRTFPDTFAKILAYPSTHPQNPADLWKIYTRSGLILDYGGTPNTHVSGQKGLIRSWLVKTSRDRSGNTIEYVYQNQRAADGHTLAFAPLRILYTGNDGVAPTRRVEFHYDTRPETDRRTLFADGLSLTRAEQLNAITMMGPDSTLVREYRFVYTVGAGSGRSLLRNMRECAADGSCKPRTTFRWSSKRPVFERFATTIAVPRSPLSAPMMLDVTGDGLDDLVVPTVPWNAAQHSEIPTTDWTLTPNHGLSPAKGAPFLQNSIVAYSQDNNDAKNDPIFQQQPDLQVQPDYGTPIDYNDDGLTDVLVHNVHGTSFNFAKTWQVLLATPQHTFTPHDTGITRPPHLVDQGFRLGNPDASAHLADVNGDGIADLVQCERDESKGFADAFHWTLRRWTPAGPGFEAAPRTITALEYFHCAWEIRPVDLDADGKVDLVFPDISPTQKLPSLDHVSLHYDEASDTWENEPIGHLSASAGAPLFLDINGDALPDLVKLDLMTGQPVAVLNTGARGGKRFGGQISSEPIHGDLSALWGLAAVIDHDGDGRQDVLVPLKAEDGFLSWVILHALGNGRFSVLESGLPFNAELSQQGATIANRLGPRISDVDGDGAPDVVLPIGTVFNIFRATGPQDLLVSVHDGLNARDPGDPAHVPTLVLAYGTLIDASNTEGASTDDAPYLAQSPLGPACAYPLRCVVGPRQVVREYGLNNGADTLRRFRVSYRDGRYDRRGRGFLGFGAKITTDLDTGAGNLAVYGDTQPVDVGSVTTYPEAGQLREEIRWTPNPRPQDPLRIELSFSSIERELRPTHSDATYFLMPIKVAQERRQGSWNAKNHPSLHTWLRLAAKANSVLLGGSNTVTKGFDDYGNALGSVTTADEVDLVSTVSEVKVDNDPTTWLLGQLRHQKECSKAAQVEQCRSLSRSYSPKTGLMEHETLDAEGDATAHLDITLEHDAFGNITNASAEDAIGNKRVSLTKYDASGVFPLQHENALGHVVQTTFDPGLGVLRTRVDENGLKTTWAHDGFGRMVREIRPDATERWMTFRRAKDGGREQDAWNVKVTNSVEGGEYTVVEYDSRARPIRRWMRGTQTGADPPRLLVQEIAFDALGERVARRTLPVDEALPAESRHADTFVYDPLGRLLTHTTAWGAITDHDYEGNTVVVSDPLKKKTVQTYDGLGRLVSVSDAEGGITSYTYGPFGGLWTVTDPGGAITSTVRDALGRVRTSVDPDKGTTTLVYNGFGDVVSLQDQGGRSTTFSYDALGRRTHRDDEAPGVATETTRWTWDTARKGALSMVEAPGGATNRYSYDALGRPSATERTIGGESFNTAVTYDALGRLAILSYPASPGLASFEVKRDYDLHGHLIRVSDAGNGQNYWRLRDTDEADRIAVESFGNGFTTTRDYFDDRGALKSLHTAKGEMLPVQDLAYEYDAKQNLRSRHDALQAENKTEFFQYDGLDRLTCASFSNASACPEQDRYSYAANGNLLRKPGIEGVYVYDANRPHAVLSAGADSFGYDPVGNQIKRAGMSVSYTAFDMPKVFTPAPGKGGVAVTLDYDGDQKRVRKTAGDEVTVYVGEVFERTTNSATGAVEHRYFVSSSERVVAVVTRAAGATSSQKTRYLHTDHLGSVESVTDETGDIAVEKRSYDAFGARRNPVWGAAPVLFSSVTTRGFTGHEDDEDLGLVNMKGRIYDPKIGRFLTTDPIVSHPGFGQSYNPYSYVLDNPLSYVDPSGFEDEALYTADVRCSGCAGGTRVDGETTVTWGFTPLKPPAPPQAPPPPNVDQSLAGLGGRPVDLGVTGNAGSAPPQPPADGAGGAGGAGGASGAGLPPVAVGVGTGVLEHLKHTFVPSPVAIVRAFFAVDIIENAVDGAHQDGALGALAGGLNTLNPLYQVAVGAVGIDQKMAAGDDEGAARDLTQLTLSAGTAILAGALGAEASSAPQRIRSGSILVTEQVIRDAMKDAPLASQQAGGVSLPTVQRYVNKLLAGEVAPAIKVDGKLIVDGNHRYIAGRIFGREPAIQPWAGGRGPIVPWNEIKISTEW